MLTKKNPYKSENVEDLRNEILTTTPTLFNDSDHQSTEIKDLITLMTSKERPYIEYLQQHPFYSKFTDENINIKEFIIKNLYDIDKSQIPAKIMGVMTNL